MRIPHIFFPLEDHSYPLREISDPLRDISDPSGVTLKRNRSGEPPDSETVSVTTRPFDRCDAFQVFCMVFDPKKYGKFMRLSGGLAWLLAVYRQPSGKDRRLPRPPHVSATRSPGVFIYQELGHLSSGPIRSPSKHHRSSPHNTSIRHPHTARTFPHTPADTRPRNPRRTARLTPGHA